MERYVAAIIAYDDEIVMYLRDLRTKRVKCIHVETLGL